MYQRQQNVLCCCGWWRAEESQEQSLSEVTQGWMFIFRALDYLTTTDCVYVCVCVCAHAHAGMSLRESVCHYLSESQEDVACCPLHTRVHHEGSVCRERSGLKGSRVAK